MPRKILVDVNVPREVCERLSELGFEAEYLPDILPRNIKDEKIIEWVEKERYAILTRDKDFPENEGNLKITLVGESPVKLSRQSFNKLTKKGVYPTALDGSWEENKEQEK